MNILDFEDDIETTLTFEGDNETDCNRLDMQRVAFDGYGNEIQVAETYYMPRSMLEDIATGLDKMAKNIRTYLS